MQPSLWENIKTLFFQYRWRFAKALAMLITANVLMILTPVIFRQAVLTLTSNTTSSNLLANTLQTLLGPHLQDLWAWTLLLIIIALTAAFFKYRMRIAFMSVSRDAEAEVRSKLFSRIQQQSMAFYDRHGIGELMSRLTNDISAYRDVLGPGIMYPLFFITLVIPGLIALFFISIPLALVSLLPLIAIPIVNLATRQKIYHLSHIAQKGLADLSNMAQEHYSGIRIVKGYAAEKSLTLRFKKLCHSLVNANIKLNNFQGLLYPFFTLITKSITVLLVIATGFIVLKAWSNLRPADFVSFMWIQSYIYFPVLMLAWVLPIYERGRAAYERLVEVYVEPIEVKDTGQKDLSIPPNASIEFKDLTFFYPNAKKPALNHFSAVIKGGSFVGITGPIGAGKTTLFRLLNREYEVPRGTILIDGKDIHDYPLTSFWEQIVTVEQIPFIFSRTVAENVRFGKREALQTEVETVAQYADLHDTVLSFPEQYETPIGERGVTLSGGQKQRLAMARAFLVDRPFLLLDDVFSAVDTETELRVLLAMQQLFKNKTVLLITHRASILDSLDRIIYMQDGVILEDGSPSKLRSKKGHYAALVELQGGTL